jgi:hypothetical protein
MLQKNVRNVIVNVFFQFIYLFIIYIRRTVKQTYHNQIARFFSFKADANKVDLIFVSVLKILKYRFLQLNFC